MVGSLSSMLTQQGDENQKIIDHLSGLGSLEAAGLHSFADIAAEMGAWTNLSGEPASKRPVRTATKITLAAIAALMVGAPILGSVAKAATGGDHNGAEHAVIPQLTAAQKCSFPIKLPNYDGILKSDLRDSNLAGVLKSVSSYEAQHDAAMREVFPRTLPKSQNYHLDKATPESDGFLYLKHDEKHNKNVTLAGALNLLGLNNCPNSDLVDEAVVQFLKTNRGIDAGENDIRITKCLLNGNYTEVTYKGEHIAVKKGDVIPFKAEWASEGIQQNLEEAAIWSEFEENFLRGNALTNLYYLSQQTPEVQNAVNASIDDCKIEWSEFLPIWEQHAKIMAVYERSRESLKSSLKPGDFKQFEKRFSEYEDNMNDFFNAVSGKIPGHLKGYGDNVFQEAGKMFQNVRLHGGVNLMTPDFDVWNDFWGGGLALESDGGVYLDLGYYVHPTEKGSFTDKPVDVEFPLGTMHGEKWGGSKFDASFWTAGAGAKILKNFSIGGRFIQMDQDHSSWTKRLEQIDYDNGVSVENTSSDYTSNGGKSNHMGPEANFKVPVGGDSYLLVRAMQTWDLKTGAPATLVGAAIYSPDVMGLFK